MTHQISQLTNPPLTYSMLISEAVYRLVVRVERLARLFVS